MKFTLKIFTLLSLVILSTLANETNLEYKLIVYESKSPSPSLTEFNYKSVNIKDEYLTVYSAKAPEVSLKEQSTDTSTYLKTLKLNQILRLCIDSSSVCTIGQFLQEFGKKFEVQDNLPSLVAKGFSGDEQKPFNQCLFIILEGVSSLEEGTFICHEDLKVVIELQETLSQLIKISQSKNDFNFEAQHYFEKTLYQGKVTLNKDSFKFLETQETGKGKFEAKIENLDFYSVALFQKEIFDIKNDAKENIAENCFRLNKLIDTQEPEKHYFCSYDSQPNSSKTKNIFHFNAYIYALKLNRFLQDSAVAQALKQISQNPKVLEVDSNKILPLKMEVRSQYLNQRHLLTNSLNLGKISKNDYNKALSSKVEDIIINLCSNFKVCEKALLYSFDKGHIPLTGSNELYAMDLQNPFLKLVPSENIKINLPSEGGKGEQILDQVTSIKGMKNYFVQEFEKEKSLDSTLNKINLNLALNTLRPKLNNKSNFQNLKEAQVGICQAKVLKEKSQRRKVSLLMYASDDDMYFNYFSEILGKQLLN